MHNDVPSLSAMWEESTKTSGRKIICEGENMAQSRAMGRTTISRAEECWEGTWYSESTGLGPAGPGFWSPLCLSVGYLSQCPLSEPVPSCVKGGWCPAHRRHLLGVRAGYLRHHCHRSWVQMPREHWYSEALAEPQRWGGCHGSLVQCPTASGA